MIIENQIKIFILEPVHRQQHFFENAMGLIDWKISNIEDEKSFKQRKSLAIRKEEFNEIRQRFPNKIPVGNVFFK